MSKKIDEEDLINIIKYINNKYGFFATSLMKKEENMPNRDIFRRRFGSLDNALIKAGINIEENKKQVNKNLLGVDKTYSNDYLINKLIEYNNKYGFPTTRGIKKNKNYPTEDIYRQRFGSFKNAILIAGIEIPKEKERYFDRKQIDISKEINKLKHFISIFVEKYQTVPTCDQIRQQNININVLTKKGINILDLIINFGYKNFIKKSILKIKTTKEETNIEILLQKFKKVIIKYGQINCKDFEKYGLISYSAYLRKLNMSSYYDLLKLINVKPSIKNSFLTDKSIKEIYNSYKKNLGHIPSLKEIITYSKIFNLPDIHNNIIYRWNGYTEFLIEMNDYKKSKTKILFSKKGVKCFSRYELLFANYFDNKNIEYKKEIYYKNVIKDFKKNWQFDFYLPKYDLYIEIFGIEGNIKYNNKTIEKQNICKNNNIKLISIFPQNFINNMYDVKNILKQYIKL